MMRETLKEGVLYVIIIKNICAGTEGLLVWEEGAEGKAKSQ